MQLAPQLSTKQLTEDIVRRTHGRIRRLRVDWVDGRLALEGEAPSYHVLQLALQAVCDLGEEIDVQIRVSGK